MEIIEMFVKGKHNDHDLCEDEIVISNNYLAVIDGSTAKGNKKINNVQPGKAIVQSISFYLMNSSQSLSGEHLIDDLNLFIKNNLLRPNGITRKTVNCPSASIAIYSIASRTITIVGDISIKIDDIISYKTNNFDKTMSQLRSVINCLAKERKIEMLTQDNVDVGRMFIIPILKKQHIFRNSSSNSLWNYGNIDGFKVPKTLIEKIVLKPNQEVTLFTDGYPRIDKDLNSTEFLLSKILEEDPLQTIKYLSTKGKTNGLISYDDRAYLRFRT